MSDRERGLTGPWLAQRLGADPIALEGRRRAGELFAVRPEGSSDWLYPAWQFDDEWQVRPAVQQVLRAAHAARLTPAELNGLLARRVGLSGGGTMRDLLRRGDANPLLEAIRSGAGAGSRAT